VSRVKGSAFMENSKIFRFEASHILPKHPGKCSRLHGHSWVLKVSVEGEINQETGFVMDYADISKAVQPVIEALDHNHLGTWSFSHQDTGRMPIWNNKHAVIVDPYFYPSSENLIVWIGTQLRSLQSQLLWSKLELNETCTSSCVLTREEYEQITRPSARSVETEHREVKKEQVIP
jgi:6-pyruvoyltetrahydropterin/6-carboxytetrahydropterin synthase